jgi:NAD(P)-dependent dehydrogenase (short-subunit alcohol dehydrogenase family)
MILITGASRGIGKFLLTNFIAQNERVLGTYYSSGKQNGFNKYLSFVDVKYPDEVNEWVEFAHKYMGKVHDEKLVLINCAGINYNAMAHKADFNDWTEVIKTNLIGSFNTISLTLPIMRKYGYGRIINFGSVVAKIGVPGTSAYAASKAGLWGLTKAIAAENATKGITINTINLGYFDIGMIQEVPEQNQQQIKDKILCGKFGDTEMIWKTVNFIIDNDYLNGAEIDLNGGLW